ncbi:glycosyltransferase family 9 protein [Terriglobus albidus]|nr:glycosyltransferase family 9 protein [Terriglobus albidus]
MADHREAVVYGVFKAMGDLLSAVAVIRKQLDLGYRVHLLIFPRAALKDFISLLDLGPNNDLLSLHDVPAGGRLFSFLKEMSRLRPKGVWISPHAPIAAASRKIPIGLRLVRDLFWRGTSIGGADSEPHHWLFDVAVPVDRKLPLGEREWGAFRMWRPAGMGETRELPQFLPEIMGLRNEPYLYDLLIHPGASTWSRMWSVDHYVEMVKLLPRDRRIGMLGLPHEIVEFRDKMPEDWQVEFLSGSLKNALMTIARARVMLCMDSGIVHVAKVLQVPTAAIFGKTDPVSVIGPEDDVITPIYERKFDCQPCGQRGCSQPELYCMNVVTPATVANVLTTLLQQTDRQLLVQL